MAFLSTFAIMAMITLFSVALVTQAACTPAPTAGDDTIVCTGTSGNVNGGDGSDSITNNGVMGNMRGGSGNDSLVNSDGATADNLYGNAGNDNILNSGTVTGGIEGGNGNDTITNNGIAMVLDGGDGDDTITNNGTAGCIYGGDGDDIITNNGTVSCVVEGDDGDDIITNNGQVADHVLGGGDNDTMTNGLTGVIEGSFRGNGGDDTLVNYGTVKRNMNGNNGNDVVINYGIVERNLRGGDGSDVIQQMLGSVVLENIEGGDGDDNVYLYGGLVGGVIDGGADNDTLHFLQVVADCQEYEALNASFSTWNPATGAVTINAFFYSWLNFETLINGLVGQNCEISSITVTIIPNDGRLNYNDLVRAPIAVYCHVGGGINIIGLTGESSFLVEKNAIARAQASALSSKKPVILQAKGGNTLLVGDDGLLIATSPNPNNATDIYTFVFDWQTSCEEELKAS
jgi:hypothetical protein